MVWAVVVDNVVLNIVIVGPATDATNLTQIPDGVGVGWRLIDGIWTAPAPIPQRLITSLAFWQRLTVAERIGIRTSQDLVVADLVALLTLVSGHELISLDDANLNAGMNYIASVGLMTAERVSEVMA